MLNVNLIDVAEAVALKMNLYFNRMGDHELAVQLVGKNIEYDVAVILRKEYDILYCSCDLNIIVPKKSLQDIHEAIVKINERIWIGHFDLISLENRIVYSLSMPFIGSFVGEDDIVTSIFNFIVEESDRFYHYFAMIVDKENIDNFSLNSLFLESAGEA